MRKLIFILLFLPIVCSGQITEVRIPDNTSFTLDTVRKSLELSSNTNLRQCFTETNLYFSNCYDPTYNTSSYAPDSSLLRYRNFCKIIFGEVGYSLFYKISINGSETVFYTSQELAEQACYDIENPAGRSVAITANGNIGLLEIGSKSYNQSYACSSNLPDGYYLIGSWYDHYIVHIVNKIVDSYTTCP